MVTCWERFDLLALVGDVYCIFVTFSCGILGQVWILIVYFPDLCLCFYFSYFNNALSQRYNQIKLTYYESGSSLVGEPEIQKMEKSGRKVAEF